MRIPFIGGSYQSRTLNLDAQRCINLYAEMDESKGGKNVAALIGTPGFSSFLTLPAFPLRGQWVALGRLFVVAGSGLYEVFAGGTNTLRGALLTGSGNVGLSDNGLQLCIVDGPNEYILTLATNVYQTNPAGGNFPGSSTVSFIDGYFTFTEPSSGRFHLSGLYDGTTIDPLDFATKEGAPDNLVTTFNDHRQLYLFGADTTEVWYNSGAANFPFQPIQGIFIETGCIAPFSVAKNDNSIVWLGKDIRGQGVVYKIQNFAPIRISTHAMEKAMKGYGDLSSAIGYSYQDEGHAFYCLNFPGADTTWVHDSATSLWHERRWLDQHSGLMTHQREFFHSFAFGKHIVGDYATGDLYVSSLDTYTHNSVPIVRQRAATYIHEDKRRISFPLFELDMETGVGLDGIQQGTDPQVMLEYSNDGGHNFSNGRWKSAGKIGDTTRRVYWNQCGQSRGRSRVHRITITDPVKVALIDAKIVARVVGE